jgi:hypothetical protein
MTTNKTSSFLALLNKMTARKNEIEKELRAKYLTNNELLKQFKVEHDNATFGDVASMMARKEFS